MTLIKSLFPGQARLRPFTVLLAPLALLAPPHAAFARVADPTVLTPVIVQAAPLPGASADRRSVPADVETVLAQDVQRTNSPSVLDGLQQRIPGAFLSDVQGSPYAQSLDFHGFAASPVPGAPQGLAVYLGGVRLNEAFGDTVNWDLVPEIAIAQADLFTGDPVFGLNALGGAAALRMKTGKTWRGTELTLQGGSFGRGEGALQYGRRDGDWTLYLAADGGREDGWRQRSPSRLSRLYADAGYDHGPLEAHLVVAGSASFLGVVGPTPADLVAQDRTAVFTSPQKTRSDDALVSLNARYAGPRGWTLSGDLHLRTFNQRHTDGNDADVEGCEDEDFAGTLCLESDGYPDAIRPPAAAFQILGRNGASIPCPQTGDGPSCAGVPYGTIDRTRTDADTYGASAQAASTTALLGRRNLVVVGAAVDHSTFDFSADSKLGFISPDFVVAPNPDLPGQGEPIHTTGLIGYAPVHLSGTRTDYGLYLSDALDLTDRLTLTASGRYNEIRINTRDEGGDSPDLNGRHDFARFNPHVGLAWRALDALTVYGGYSEANRAPTPLELSCSDPDRPCLLENALVADPPLRQVSSRTWEGGVKGGTRLFGGRLEYRASGYDTELDDDIVALASTIQGRGYYANVPRTRRRGFDLGADFHGPRLDAYAGYAFVDATYQFSGVLASPNNPIADEDGTITVSPGDCLGAIPRHRLKIGANYALTPALTVGADVLAISDQRFAGDETGANPKLSAYWTLEVRAEWRLTPHLAVFAHGYNLLDRNYATYGTYFDPDGVSNAGSALPAHPDVRSVTPAASRNFRAGVRFSW